MELLLVIQSKAFWVIFQSSVEVKHHRGYKKKRISESDLTVQQILFVQFLIVSYARTTGAYRLIRASGLKWWRGLGSQNYIIVTSLYLILSGIQQTNKHNVKPR